MISIRILINEEDLDFLFNFLDVQIPFEQMEKEEYKEFLRFLLRLQVQNEEDKT